MPLLARLSNKNVLEGFEKVSLDKCRDGKGQIAFPNLNSCDLEPGKYKWDEGRKAFIPLGHGFGKPKGGPCPSDYALYLACKMTAQLPGATVPKVLQDWLEWYGMELAPRYKERLGD